MRFSVFFFCKAMTRAKPREGVVTDNPGGRDPLAKENKTNKTAAIAKKDGRVRMKRAAGREGVVTHDSGVTTPSLKRRTGTEKTTTEAKKKRQRREIQGTPKIKNGKRGGRDPRFGGHDRLFEAKEEDPKKRQPKPQKKTTENLKNKNGKRGGRDPRSGVTTPVSLQPRPRTKTDQQ